MLVWWVKTGTVYKRVSIGWKNMLESEISMYKKVYQTIANMIL